MFNPLNLISKFIKSSNQKELDRIEKIVKNINSLENKFEKLNDLEFPIKTQFTICCICNITIIIFFTFFITLIVIDKS